MARRYQVQEPAQIGATPQARVTDRFVQAKYVQPIPPEVLDLMPFSQTLRGLVNQVHEASIQRQIQLGEATVALSRPFGSPTAQTPAENANRKQIDGLVKEGKLARSDNPYFRLGMAVGEARRNAVALENEALSEETLAKLSRSYDDNGDLILNQTDGNAAFDQILQKYNKAPALQNRYVQRVAIDLFDGVRAKFNATLAGRRDVEYQKYHETEATNQLTDYLGRLSDLRKDTTPQGQKLYQDARKGFDDLRVEMTAKAGLADPMQTARNAATAFVLGQAEISSERGKEAISFVRQMQVGSRTIDDDNSEGGIKFREYLERREREYELDGVQEKERAVRETALNRQAAKDQWEAAISKEDWSNPRAAKTRLDAEADALQAQGNEYADEFKAINLERYAQITQPVPIDAGISEEVQQRIRTQSPEQVRDWLKMLATPEVNRIGYTQLTTELATVDKQAEAYAGTKEYGDMLKSVGAQIDTLLQGKSSDGVIALNRDGADILEAARVEAQIKMAEIPPGDTAARAKAMEGVLASAREKIRAKSDALTTSRKELFALSRSSNDAGKSIHDDIVAAEGSGAITRDEAKDLLAQDGALTSAGAYTARREVADAVNSAFFGQTQDTIVPGLSSAVEQFAQSEVLKFYDANRSGMNPQQFDLAFQVWAKQTLQPELGKIAKSAFAGASFETVGARLTSVMDRVAQDGITAEEGMALQRGYVAGTALQEGIVANARNKPLALRAAAQAVWGAPVPGLDKTPKPLKALAESYGRSPANVAQARLAAMEAFSKELDTPELTAANRKALLRTGFVPPQELLAGKVLIPDPVTGEAREFPIAKGDVNPWTTQFFLDQQTYDIWKAKVPEKLEALAGKYGVRMNDPREFEAWKAQQLALIAGSAFQEPKAEVRDDFFQQ